MARFHLHSRLLVKRSLQEVFQFFEQPANLGKLTPPWLNFRILSENAAMKKGAEIRYRIHLFGLPMPWKSVISEYEPPFRFVDDQVIGPYKSWHHRHSFHPSDEGTFVEDDVDYELPLGPLGMAAHAVMVRPQLMAIFHYRQKALARQFPGMTVVLEPPTIVPVAP